MGKHQAGQPESKDAPPSDLWAHRLKRGDTAAVGEVRRRVSSILAHGRLRIPVQEREDLEQEIMAQVWQAVTRPGFDFTQGFWGFVELVASRRCIDWLRTRRQTMPPEEDVVSGMRSPLQQALNQEKETLAREILAELGPGCRKLVTLRLRDELSYGEIAGILGQKEAALRVRFYRCIAGARKVAAKMAHLPRIPESTS